LIGRRKERSRGERKEATYQFQDPQHGIDVPSLVRSEPLSSKSDLRRHPSLELVVGRLEEGK
jgi:hypothetical protein